MTNTVLREPSELERSFQDRVGDWMEQCFTPEIIADKLERADRFIEESLELVQATGYSAERAHALVDYVFNRPVGEPFQEVGGVRVTLSALCNPHGIDENEAAETELARVWTKIDKIRAKQATKPVGSALPIPQAIERLTLTPEASLREALEYAADIRFKELAEGSPFTVIDRQMLAELHRKATAALTASPTPEPCRLREALVEAANHLADEMDGILPYLAAHNWRIDMLVEAVTNVRSAITASPAEPEEATEAMIEAIKGAAFDCTQPISRRTAAAIYAAMRSAASGGEG